VPVFVDPKSGEVFANVPDEEQERARREFGLVSEDEYDRQTALKENDPGIIGSIGKGVQAGLGHIQDIARDTGFRPPAMGGEAFGPGTMSQFLGQTPQLPPTELPPGAETFPGGFDESAVAAREAHPIAFGAGMGVASAPFAAAAGAAGGALGGPALLGAGLLGVGAEAGVEGAFQEYSDAYFEKRPFELKNVAANTLMFSGLDFAFRGALKGLAMPFKGAAEPKPSIGGRNVVSEAQGAAREFVDPVGGSVGAARAADLEEPFVDAIKQMNDRDAFVLARDADDHLHLISQDASEAFTRLNNGLSDDLGSQLKYEDFASHAAEWDEPTLARQAKWLDGMLEESSGAVQQLTGKTAEPGHALDFGNLGKKAAGTIDDFSRRIASEADPGRRIVLVDEFKKRLDKLTMGIDGSYGVDNITRSELKGLIAPVREGLRKGLESPKLFGGAADLQRSLNKPWHDLLEHWGKVQKTLTEETGHVKFDQAGAGRITRESTVDRMLGLLGKDPRSNQEFGKHLAGALENIQGLIDARQSHGIVRKDGLDALEGDIRNLMEDWNLAQTVGVAKNRAAAMKKDPRKWANLAMNLGERLPMVGEPIKLARTLGDAFQDIHISKNSHLGRVWDQAYKRYAGNAAYQDPAVIGSYSPWVADALKARGGKFMPPTPTGAIGSPAVPGMPPANANAQRSVAQPGLSASAQGALDRSRARAQQGGYAVLGRNSALPKQGFEREVELDFLQGEIQSLKKVDLGSLPEPPEYPRATLIANRKKLTPEEREAVFVSYVGPDYESIRATLRADPSIKLDKHILDNPPLAHPAAKVILGALDKLNMDNPTQLGPLYRGISIDDDALSEAMTQVEFNTSTITSSSYNPAEALNFATQNSKKRGGHPLLIKFAKVDRGAPVNPFEQEVLIPRGARWKVTGRRNVDGVLMLEVEQVGKASDEQMRKLGALGSVNLGPGSAGSGPNFSRGDVAKSPLGVGTVAAGAIGARYAMAEREPPPAQPPEHAYRDALREIEQAGQAQVRTLASEALRAKPRGKDRDTLSLFAGKGSLQDAVEETRERLDEISADPTTLLQQLGQSAGDLGKTHPSVYMAVTEKAAQVAAYLQSVIPKRSGTSLLDPRGAPVSFDRSWDYAARFVGATQPRVALREAVRGGAPPEMIEAVQQTWPELWTAFQAETLGQVQRMHAAGRHIPSEKLLRLDRLLGMGGQLDPSASLEVAQHMIAAQDAELAKRQQGGQATGAMPSSGPAAASFRTRLAAISAERDSSP